jgi:hypothetical protein
MSRTRTNDKYFSWLDQPKRPSGLDVYREVNLKIFFLHPFRRALSSLPCCVKPDESKVICSASRFPTLAQNPQDINKRVLKNARDRVGRRTRISHDCSNRH